jgi:hypothetical protein
VREAGVRDDRDPDPYPLSIPSVNCLKRDGPECGHTSRKYLKWFCPENRTSEYIHSEVHHGVAYLFFSVGCDDVSKEYCTMQAFGLHEN